MFRVIIPQLQMSVANVYFSWQSRAHPRLSRRKKRKLCLRYPRPPKWVPFPQQLWKKNSQVVVSSARAENLITVGVDHLRKRQILVNPPDLSLVRTSPRWRRRRRWSFSQPAAAACYMKTAERKQNSPPTRGNSQLTGHGTSRSLHIGGSGLCSGVAT